MDSGLVKVMDRYRELAERLRTATGGTQTLLTQGIVTKVDGTLCEVKVGGITVPGVRLRASETADDGEMLIVPKVGTAVTLGSLTGDLSQLVVLHVDHVEGITVNGGKQGGLVNVAELTARLNALVDAFNEHTHQGTHGPTGAPLKGAETFDRKDYEDTTIRH